MDTQCILLREVEFKQVRECAAIRVFRKNTFSTKHRKDCETALWAKKGFIERNTLIVEMVKSRLYVLYKLSAC